MNSESPEPGEPPGEIELSVVMPCLNEGDTLETCIRKAQSAIEEHGIVAEIIVADNGSTDGSPDIAERLGARVVPVAAKGYGSALMGGIAAARGRFIIMGDADDSYDFLEIPRFVEKLREGADLVMGCRLPWGGGRVMPGAMPFTHRWLGNPLFSRLVRLWFGAPIHDVYCGMRGFTRDVYERLDLRCTGMEFATEMVVKASLYRERTAEVPITLHPDGRVAHTPHLKTWRDGWRTLRFFLLCSPRWLYLIPGLLLILGGVAGYVVALPMMRIGGVQFGPHTLLCASLGILCGFQLLMFALFARTFGMVEGILPSDPRLYRLFDVLPLETGLLGAGAGLLVGLGLIGWAVFTWSRQQFGPLDYEVTLRLVIPGSMLVALSIQVAFSSFLVSMLSMRRQ